MIINLETPIDFQLNDLNYYYGIQVFEFYNITDYFDDKIVIGQTHFGRIVLWEGVSYDLAGDYTQLQIENRLKEILLNNPMFI